MVSDHRYLEYDEISPVVSDRDNVKNYNDSLCKEYQLDRPNSLLLDFQSSLESVCIENFLVQSSENVTDKLKVDSTLHLSEWGRWRKKSIDLPEVFSERRPNPLSSRYLGREISSTTHHEKRPCKLFLSKREEQEEEESPLLGIASYSRPVSLVSESVSPVKQNSKKKKETKRKPIDTRFLGFNPLSYLKHMVIGSSNPCFSPQSFYFSFLGFNHTPTNFIINKYVI